VDYKIVVGSGAYMSPEQSDIRVRFVGFFLFSIQIWLVWGLIDLCRYIFFGDRPSAKEIVWVVLACIVLWTWMIGETFADIIHHLHENQKRMNDLESRVVALEQPEDKIESTRR